MANVVVYLRSKLESEKFIHPSYKKTEKKKIQMISKRCRYVPHLVAMRTAQTLIYTNEDAVGHHTILNPEPISPLIPTSSRVEHHFEKEITIPYPGSCSIHPWERCYVLIRDNPYFSVSKVDGSFEMKHLPVGIDLVIQVWHEKAGYVKTVSIGGKKTQWYRGRFNITIKPGDNDLGEIKLSPVLFKE